MPVYEKCDESVHEIVNAMSEKYHLELVQNGVTIDCLFAKAHTDDEGEPLGPALLLHGYPCAAIVRTVNLKDRTKGCADAEIVIDGDRWDEWSDEEKNALLDHELQHLELICDNENVLKRDDLGRPRLKLRKHDHNFGWFNVIAERHGHNSIECRQAKALVDEYGQLYLGFVGDVKQIGEPKKNGHKSSDSGISSVTFSATGHESVTIDRNDLGKIKRAFGTAGKPARKKAKAR